MSRPGNPDQLPQPVFALMIRFHQRRSLLIDNLTRGLMYPVFLFVTAWLLHDALDGELTWYQSILQIVLITSGLNGVSYLPDLLGNFRALKSIDQKLNTLGFRPLWWIMPPVVLSTAAKRQWSLGLSAVALCVVGLQLGGDVGLLLKLAGLVGFVATGTVIRWHRPIVHN